jgi:uncharacterized MAPEG superfamily protein
MGVHENQQRANVRRMLTQDEMFGRPRQNFASLQGKVPQAVWEKCYRAMGAHLNGLEHFPLFGAAVVRCDLDGGLQHSLTRS